MITEAGLIKGEASATVKKTQATRTKELEIATEDLILTIQEELATLDRKDAKLEKLNNKLIEFQPANSILKYNYPPANKETPLSSIISSLGLMSVAYSIT